MATAQQLINSTHTNSTQQSAKFEKLIENVRGVNKQKHPSPLTLANIAEEDDAVHLKNIVVS
eukprot:1127958-Ditylum_brightwellii.AAC.1